MYGRSLTARSGVPWARGRGMEVFNASGPVTDFALVTASGADYSLPPTSTAVPEPTATVLLGAGLLRLGVRALRGRRSA